MTTDPWLTALQKNGYRLTTARRAVVEAMAHTRTALNPLEVYDQTRAACPGLGLVTVYSPLEVLDSLDLVRRVHLMNNYHGYAIATPGHTHHVVCQNCRTVVEI
jgi:Fe2+ or Zn2+ uptake regulation protein